MALPAVTQYTMSRPIMTINWHGMTVHKPNLGPADMNSTQSAQSDMYNSKLSHSSAGADNMALDGSKA